MKTENQTPIAYEWYNPITGDYIRRPDIEQSDDGEYISKPLYWASQLTPAPMVSKEIIQQIRVTKDQIKETIEHLKKDGFGYLALIEELDKLIIDLEAKLTAVEPGEGLPNIEKDYTSSNMKNSNQKYVAGFMFTEDKTKVILIRKNKPDWQKGLFNGVGGKIEPNESPLNAMIREYHEEAGVEYKEWDNFLTVDYYSSTVYFFKAFNDPCFYLSGTQEEEVITEIELNDFPRNQVIPNLNWIVNLALDPDIKFTKSIEHL
jgi:8-oxo-dGTP diphosphatase